MRVLECSSKGDKRFSAFYAKISFNGVVDSIENIYQSVKYGGEDNERVKKGEKVKFVILGKRRYHPCFLTPFYKLLWVKYLDNNPDLVAYAKEFDEFNDMFRGKSINCQADVIRDYVKKGRDYVIKDKDVQKLLYLLKKY